MTHTKHHTTDVHQSSQPFHDEALASALEVEGELAAEITRQVAVLCDRLIDDAVPRISRIADLGCGPAVAAIQLAEVFETSHVVAVDSSPAVLERAADRVARHGLADRVELRSLDLDGNVASLGKFDLVWVALALHHAQDEPAALANFASLVRPGGLLCLLERAEPTAFHPSNDLGREGLWARVESANSAWLRRTRDLRPGIADVEGYAPMLEQAKLELVDSRVVSDTAVASAGPALSVLLDKYIRTALRDSDSPLDQSDREALQRSIESTEDVDWGETHATSSRTVFIAKQERSAA